MRFSAVVSLLAFAASTLAQGNSFNLPDSLLVFQAGQPKTLTWDNKQGNTVTLKLRTGDRSNLQDVSTIASNIANTGSFTWTPPANTPEGANYAIEIINDDNTSDVNYTNQFVIQSSVKAVASGSSSGVVTATGSASGATSAATGSVTGSATGSSASATGTASGITTRTGSASSSATGTSSGTSTRAAASSTSAAGVSVPTNNAAAKPMVGAAGGLLAVAAGFAIAF